MKILRSSLFGFRLRRDHSLPLSRCLLAILLSQIAGCTSSLQMSRDALANGDYGTALAEFHPLADHGNSQAQFLLGSMYESGRGVAPDPTADRVHRLESPFSSKRGSTAW